MRRRIAILPGDGIGPEVMAQALPVLDWARREGLELDQELLPYGAEHYLASGETLPEAAFQRIRDDFDAVLFGAVGDPRIPDHRHAEEILLRLRQGLELGVNLRPCLPLAQDLVPLRSPDPRDVHIEVFRENTEGPYCLQGESLPGRAVDLAIHTLPAVERLLRAAFERARQRGCRLTLSHKANVLKHGHGLWMRVFQALRPEFADVAAEALHADALLCRLVQAPGRFGVIAADNYLGDLTSDMLAAFQGGMGMAPSLSWAPHRPFRCNALAEPVHGSAPDLAGLDQANPSGMLLSLAMLFRHLGWEAGAGRVEDAVRRVAAQGVRTPDLGGHARGSELGRAVRTELGCA